MSERGDPGFTFAGILILAAIGTFAWRSAPLESARPPSEPTAVPEVLTEGRVPARLWQDPLKAAARGHPAANQKPPDSHAAHPHEKLTCDINKLMQDGNARLKVLSVMVSPGSYSEIEERRRRRRYAVLAGLGDAGFVPRDAETLGVLSMPLSPSSSETFIPHEWYDYEDPETGDPNRKGQEEKEHVLLLWLDESRFTNSPFTRFKELISAVIDQDAQSAIDEDNNKEKVSRITWTVLGPARSGTLRHLVADQCHEDVDWLHKNSRLDRFDILSPVATVSNSDLSKHRPKTGCKKAPRCDSSPLLGPYFCESVTGSSNTTRLRFLRTIQSDDVLIGELKRELGRRGVRDNDDVVVLSEWDTYFGRFLPRAFAASESGNESAKDETPVPKFNLLRYTYARGIDGITAGVIPTKPEKVASGQDGFIDGPFQTKGVAVRRPEGTAQFDYIRRLADRIVEHDEWLRLEKGRGVRAVAILGSDVYDKLLILRALRHRLPSATWMTTDLDAHFLHPNEFKWTRNLIVASTFGLALHRDFQPSSPPFRDSYQTAVYLATRMAVATVDSTVLSELLDSTGAPALRPSTDDILPNQEKINAEIPPLLFEIGRHRAVPIGTDATTATEKALAITRPDSQVSAYFIGILLISILALFAFHQLHPLSGRPILAIIPMALAGIFLAWRAVEQTATGEPLSFSDGVSIWPTEFIRLTAIYLSVTFFWIALYRLQANARLIDNRYFCGNQPVSDAGLTLRQATETLFKSVLSIKYRAWFFGTLLLATLIMFAIPFLGSFEMRLNAKLLVVGAGWTVVILMWWLFVNGKIVPSVRLRSINMWVSLENEDQKQSAAELWTAYRENGALRHRVMRSFSYLLVYFAFGTILFSLLGSPAPPCRGDSCTWDGILLGFGVLSMLFLLFFVVDATRLCLCWIDKLRDPALCWEDSCRDKLAKQLGLPLLHATYYLQIHLIGERTTEVGRLLYYPVVIILLMLLARTTYFDDWGFPQALAVIVTANFLIAVVTAARLNSSAQRARHDILDRLQREHLELQAPTASEPAVATPNELKEIIGQLSQLRIGAFQRLWDQPLVRGSLLLFSGLGVTYAEYLPWLS